MPRTRWFRFADLPPAAANSVADTSLRPFLWRLLRGDDLSQTESEKFMRALLDRENANVEQIAAALAALAAKGETAAELAGMAAVVRERAAPFEIDKQKFIDISGTGAAASAAKTFNVSTAAAFVVAGAGLAVAKQANRRVTSATGSAEVLEALNVRINCRGDAGGDVRARETALAAFNGIGIAFLSPNAFHGNLNFVASVRKKLGLRTTFNLLGVLSNPARPPFQLVGVWHESLLEPIAAALNLLGTRRAWVVHGTDSLDELTLTGETRVVEIVDGKINRFTVAPEDFGIKRALVAHIRARCTPEESAQIIRAVLAGTRRDAARALVVLNAAAALYIGGAANTPIQAARLAEQSLDSDAARIKLERLVMTSNK